MSDALTFDVVRMYDAEVKAHVAPEVAGDYGVHRDLKRLGLPPEARPLVFHCRVLTRNQRRTVQSQASVERRYELAFCYGAISIDNFPDANKTPRTLVLARDRPDAPINDSTLDTTGLGDEDLWEIGSVIYHRSFLAHGTPLSCPLLPSSARAWAAQVSPRAELSMGSSTQTDAPPA